jgi:KaiC/GvpD/RAD55 family RecA-like ATPase
MPKINWFALVAAVLTFILIAVSWFVPWWQFTVGNPAIAEVHFSPVNFNTSFFGSTLTTPLIFAFNISCLLTLLAGGIIMLIYSVKPNKSYSKQLLGYGYKQPLYAVILFVIELVSLTVVSGILSPGLSVPLVGSTSLKIPSGIIPGADANVSIAVTSALLWPFFLAVVVASFCISARLTHSKFLKDKTLISTGGSADKLLYGGIRQNSAVALTAQSSDERSNFVNGFLEIGLQKGNQTFYVTIDPHSAISLAEQNPDDFKLFVCNPQADAFVKSAPNVFKLKGVDSLTNINIALLQAIRAIPPENKNPRRICVDIISDVLLQHGPIMTRKWLHELIAQLQNSGFTILGVINPLMHPSEQLHAVLESFDGEIAILEPPKGEKASKILKIKRMNDQTFAKEDMLLK